MILVLKNGKILGTLKLELTLLKILTTSQTKIPKSEKIRWNWFFVENLDFAFDKNVLV